MPVIKRIMCPIDFTDTATVGAREAATLAHAAGAELLLVHALSEPWLSTGDEPGYASPIVQQYELVVRHKLEQLAKRLADTAQVRCLLVRGRVEEAIAQAAAKHSADVIVMATRTRKGLAKLMPESITERVMRSVRVPVVRVCLTPRRARGSLLHGHNLA